MFQLKFGQMHDQGGLTQALTVDEATDPQRGSQSYPSQPLRRGAEGNRLDYKPVQLKPLSVETVPPKARTF